MTIITGFFSVFIYGVIGGVLGEVLKLFNMRTLTKLPKYIKSPFYWIVTTLMILSGGFLATLFEDEGIKAILAVNIGLSCPLILRTLLENGITAYDKFDASTQNVSYNMVRNTLVETEQFETCFKKTHKIYDFLAFLAGR